MATEKLHFSAMPLLLELFSGKWMAMAGALLLTFTAVLAELVPFWTLYRVIDIIVHTPGDFVSQLPSLVVFLSVALVVKYLAYAGAYLISHHAAYDIMSRTRVRLVAGLAQAPLSWLHAQGSGALKQSVIQDVERLENFLAHHTVEITAALLAPICVTCLVLWVDWRLAMAVLAVGPLAIFTSLLGMRGVESNHDRFNLATARLNNVIVEYLRNMAVMKVFCRSASGFHLLQTRLQEYVQLAEGITRRSVPIWALFTSTLGSHMLLVLPLGAWLHARGDVNPADVALAMMLGAGIFKPLLKISRFFVDIPPILAALRRMRTVLVIGQHGGTGRNIAQQDSSVPVELKQVSVRYGERTVLKSMSLSLTPNSLNVVVGPSGAGKSTLAQLVAGLVEPDSGQVLLQGRLVSQLTDDDRAGLVSMATQDAFLFRGTIRYNLCLAKPCATDEEIQRALRVAQASELVRQLPGGLDYRVDELGGRLSGGERQRLSIARVLLVDAAIVILDEATAFADSLTQRAFFLALRQQYSDRTFLVVTHRLSGIDNADQILVIEDGQLTRHGTHARMMQLGGYYPKMLECEASCEDWSLSKHDGYLEHTNTSDLKGGR